MDTSDESERSIRMTRRIDRRAASDGMATHCDINRVGLETRRLDDRSRDESADRLSFAASCRPVALALALARALWPWGLAAGRAGPPPWADRSCWIRSRSAAARSNSSFSAASSISASRALRYSSVASVASSRPTALRTTWPGLDLLLDPPADRLDDRLGRDAVLGVVRELQRPAAVGLVDGPLHRGGDLVGVEDDLGVDVPGRPADRLDQRGLAAEEAFLVGVEDADHRDLGQVEPLAEQVDADQGVERPFAQLAEDRHPLEGVELGVQPLAAQPLLLEVAREVLGQPLGERGDEHPLALRGPLLDLLQQRRHLAPRRLDADDRVDQARWGG